MNALVKLRPLAWRAEALSPAGKEKHFLEARTRVDELQRMGQAFRRAGYIVGGIGCAVGVAGMVCAATLFPLKKVENHYFGVSELTGQVGEVAGPADAPKLFGELVAEQYLRAYIEARESYVFDTKDLMFHRAAIMSDPDEQERFARWFGPRTNPESPQLVYGSKNSVRVQNLRFSRLPGAGKGKTLVYQVRFDRVEMMGGQPSQAKPWSATVQFQWHPELEMSRDDRTLNPAGLQVIAYGSQSEGSAQ